MVPTPRPRMVALGSGSSGNATAITDGTTTVLVDCGLSAAEVARRLRAAAIEPSSVSAILVTHEHGDHVRGIDVFVRRDAPGCPVYSTRGTLQASRLDFTGVASRIRPGETFRVGSLEVTAFRTSHDAAEPVGFRIASGSVAIGIATDTGIVTREVLEALAGCALIGLECNHDVKLLASGPYPPHLKRRIDSAVGHLSNDSAGDALEALAHDDLRAVFALHRSHANNTAELAGAVLVERLARIGLQVPVVVASQSEVCDSDPPQGSLFYPRP